MKTLLTGVVCLLFLLTIAACSGNDPVPKPTDDNNAAANEGTEPDKGTVQEKVSIRFTWWGDTTRHEKYNGIADRFEQKYPNIKVVREFGSWNDYWDKLATQTAGGNAPDVVSMHQFNVANYARRNALLDLTPYVQSGDLDLSDFPQPVTDSGKLDEKLLMVAKGVTMTGWVYNTGLLDKLGVKYPEFDWTWDDFIAKAAEIKQAFKSDDHWGASDMSSNLTILQYYVRQRGKQLFTPEGKLGFDKQDLVDWFAMWDKMRKDKIIPDAETNAQYANVSLEQGLFVTQKVGLTQIPVNQIPNHQKYITDGNVQAVRMPTNPDGQNGEFIEGAYLSVSAKSKHPKEAVQFINFFVNSEESINIFKVEQGALGSSKMNEFVKTIIDPPQQRAVDFIEKTLKLAERSPLPPVGRSQIESLLKDTSDSIAFGKSSIEEASDLFMTKARSILQ